ncbi:MAG: 5-methyltetrahydropteroyltriglutamate--homocysteine methyltransferase [Alphaproteobacteria bacterium]|nr:5-methyltetrahydropteroyltriglutamate--homocysteine methyltransferase [Alphaproteobacteria bacterium]
MARALPLLPTTLVGSYPQPAWLFDQSILRKMAPPRVRATRLWRVAPDDLEEAQDDATVAIVREQERAGIDVVTDGEVRRESYSNRFATALAGIDPERLGRGVGRMGQPDVLPLISGPLRRRGPVEVRDVEVLRRATDRPIRVTIPGPFTLAQQADDQYYGSPAKLAMAFAEAVNAEVRDLFAAGADVVQLDEPYMQARPQPARDYGVAAVSRALDGIAGVTAIHLCFGYAALVKNRPPAYDFLTELTATPVRQISIETAQSGLDLAVLRQLPGKDIMLGVLDLSTHEVETPQVVAGRIRRALPHVAPERLIIAPDCGMKYLPRAVAFAKLVAMVEGARIVRRELKAG